MTIILHIWNPQREKKDNNGENITEANINQILRLPMRERNYYRGEQPCAVHRPLRGTDPPAHFSCKTMVFEKKRKIAKNGGTGNLFSITEFVFPPSAATVQAIFPLEELFHNLRR